MDGQRFDRIARTIGTTPTRRGVLRLLLGGVLGGLLGGGRQAAQAACPVGQDCDSLPCGGDLCTPDNECQEGTCNPTSDQCDFSNLPDKTACTGGGICCSGSCISQHVGSCGCPATNCNSIVLTCKTATGCSAGTCQYTPVANGSNGPLCPATADACQIRDCQSGNCQTRPKANNTPCGTEMTCQGGACVASPTTCQTGLTLCGSRCVNLNTNEKNCGECGKKCRNGKRCRRGKCR